MLPVAQASSWQTTSGDAIVTEDAGQLASLLTRRAFMTAVDFDRDVQL